MNKTSLYIILVIIGLLAVFSYFRIQSQTQTENIIVNNTEQALINFELLNETLLNISEINNRSLMNEELLQDTIDNITQIETLQNITLFRLDSVLTSFIALEREQDLERPRIIASFNQLVNETSEVLERLTSGVNRQDEIVENQERIISLLENLNRSNNNS